MTNSIEAIFLQSAIKRFKEYKTLADKTFAQLEEKDFYFQPGSESNSIAIIVQHLSGNMLSRWTNFLTEDGEKSWRNRDEEFFASQHGRQQLMEKWEEGWSCLFDALQNLTENDLAKTIYIRTEPLIVIDAINRQLAHYPHHVGQIVYLGKMIRNEGWKTLTIAKGKSGDFNSMMKR